MWKLQQDREQAQQPKARKSQGSKAAKPEPRCTVCGGPVPQGVIVGTCNAPECYDAADIFEGVAAVKAAFGSTAEAVVQTI